MHVYMHMYMHARHCCPASTSTVGHRDAYGNQAPRRLHRLHADLYHALKGGTDNSVFQQGTVCRNVAHLSLSGSAPTPSQQPPCVLSLQPPARLHHVFSGRSRHCSPPPPPRYLNLLSHQRHPRSEPSAYPDRLMATAAAPRTPRRQKHDYSRPGPETPPPSDKKRLHGLWQDGDWWCKSIQCLGQQPPGPRTKYKKLT